jgi:UDP-glucose 4-epimerase
MAEMRIMVTGSAGFIGRAAADRLSARGHDVVGYDLAQGRDVRSIGRLIDEMYRCEAVAHLAGISYPRPGMGWRDYLDTNVVGTMNVAQAAVEAGARRLVYSSSTSFYGAERGFCNPMWPVDEESPPAIAWMQARAMTVDEEACLFYSTAKVLAEYGLAAAGLRRALDVIILRFCPTSATGTPYAWGLRTTLGRAVDAIVRAVEDRRAVGFEVFNIAEPDVDVVDTGRWERWCDAGDSAEAG